MKAISQFVVRLVDLLEAEGRAAMSVARSEARHVRRMAAHLALGVAVLCIAVPLCLGSVWLLTTGLRGWLETEVSRPLAAGLSGLVLLAVGAACFGGAVMLIGRSPQRE